MIKFGVYAFENWSFEVEPLATIPLTIWRGRAQQRGAVRYLAEGAGASRDLYSAQSRRDANRGQLLNSSRVLILAAIWQKTLEVSHPFLTSNVLHVYVDLFLRPCKFINIGCNTQGDGAEI